MNKLLENNQATLIGTIESKFEFSHETYGEKFYTMQVSAKRLSVTKDILPVMVSERLIDVTQDYTGEMVEVYEQFRSYNKHDDKHSKLILFVFAREIKFAEEGTYHTNNILLDGFICKPPVYRKTPNGREIADILLAVNRPHGISDYIPCICWGRDARYIGGCEVGDNILLQGRIQSREYTKKVETEVEKRTAYEVSAYWLEDKTA